MAVSKTRAPVERTRAKAGSGKKAIKPAICVRVDQSLFDMIKGEADRNDRTVPGQVRHNMRERYGIIGPDTQDDSD